MESEGVIGVKRIQRRVDGNLVDTATHILTFNKPKLPNKVKAAFYSLDVRPYIPNPLRCFNCQKFGHITTACQDTKICACGKAPHTGEVCSDPINCVNCGGPDSAKSRNCPRMIEEVDIQKVKVLENLSYAEARRKVRGPRGNNQITYVQAAARNNQTIAQQLLPEITRVIESQIRSMLSTLMPNSAIQQPGTSSQVIGTMGPPYLYPKSGPLERSGSISDTSQITNPELKRKRSEVKYPNASVESDDSLSGSQLSNTSKKGKNKRGWPKGKPRSVPSNSQDRTTEESQSSVAYNTKAPD